MKRKIFSTLGLIITLVALSLFIGCGGSSSSGSNSTTSSDTGTISGSAN